MKKLTFPARILGVVSPCMAPMAASASMFSGETLDTVANVMAWIVLIVVPVIALTGFWLVHILPEKIAEQRKHPQAKAIQVLCLLSLFFGGLLWPLAWLWAYSKPVLYKMAYGTDVAEPEHGKAGQPDTAATTVDETARSAELVRLRQRIAELEAAPRSTPGSMQGAQG